MTVGELGVRMDAAELMEWMAYFILQDEKEVQKLNQEILNEKGIEYHNKELRSLLTAVGKSKKRKS